MRPIIAAVLLACLNCSSSPTEPGSGTSTATLRYGETAIVGGSRVSFTEIADSRCPKEVVCVWEGDASVRLESGAESVVLHTSTKAGAATGKLGNMTITLTEVQPERISPTEVKKSDYVVKLRVSA